MVSALNVLHDVIVERQSFLLDDAVQAGVPRFIPSDYSEDFTATTRGDNRNLDLRREFMGRADRAPIQVTTILNGAFMDMLGAEMPIIQPRIHRVLYWINPDQLMDFTTKDDVAAYVAAAALDDTTLRILRIAGDTLSAREIAGVMSDVTGKSYKTMHAGNLGVLGLMIGVAKQLAPQPGDPFPAWQGMQYMRDMFSGKGKLTALDNGLCCLNWFGLGWIAVTELKPYRHRFPMTIIHYAVWLYHRFPLSYRDVQELLHQRGIEVSIVVNGRP